MNENKTVRELIDEVVRLQEMGEWSKSFKALAVIVCDRDVTEETAGEIDMIAGWNKWKMGDKDSALKYWLAVLKNRRSTVKTQAGAHAGLAIYYSEKADKEKTLRHAKLALELLPKNATLSISMNLNACGIARAKIGELDGAEKVLRKVAGMNEELERSKDPAIEREGALQRAKNGYNLSSLIYMKQGRFEEALNELLKEVIPRCIEVGAKTDLAAAYHQVAAIYENRGNFEKALEFEERSKAIWDEHIKDDPKRSETAQKNISRIKEKMGHIDIGEMQATIDLPKNVSERDKENE